MLFIGNNVLKYYDNIMMMFMKRQALVKYFSKLFGIITEIQTTV